MQRFLSRLRSVATMGLLAGSIAALAAPSVFAQRFTGPRPGGQSRTGAKTATPAPGIQVWQNGAARAPQPAFAYDERRLAAGHILRRAGFGPSPADMQTVLSMGANAWIEQQLNPNSIDDSEAETRFYPVPDPFVDDFGSSHQRRWITRMIYSRRQLLEKMTLFWHERLAVSINKVGNGKTMHDYELLLRRNALGNFRQLLVEISKDTAMLIYLDNSGNWAYDDDGNLVPPNENYARELFQLFSLGPVMLNQDGTPVLDGGGVPVPAYSETDVREAARAMTGWYGDWEGRTGSEFYDWGHDPGVKNVLGKRINPRQGADGAREVDDVVDAIMDHPNTAPFLAKEMILKFATETPSPDYVERVADVFKQSDGDIKATMRAVLTDPEFTSASSVRTQFKTPLEYLIGPVRALDLATEGNSVIAWTYLTGHMPYVPPSVFSFYRPGGKSALVTASQTAFLDYIADDLVDYYSDDWSDVEFNSAGFITANRLKKSKKAVDLLADRLLAAPLEPETRQAVIDYMGKRVTEEKLRGAIWLIITSPEFQLN